MKAKEYIERIINKEPLEDVLTSMYKETHELFKSRNVNTNFASVAVINEQNQKWRSIARKTGLSEDLYILSMETLMPEMMHAIKKLKEIGQLQNIMF